MQQTTAQPTEADVKAAKERRTFLQKRLLALQAEEVKLAREAEEGQEKILLAFVEGQDPEKVRADVVASRERLKFTRDAIRLCKQSITEAEEIANHEELIEYRKRRDAFARKMVRFIDSDYAAFLAAYKRLEPDYWDVWNRGSGYRDERAYIEKEVFELFWYVLNDSAVPQDLKTLKDRFAAWFDTARKSK